MLNLRDDVHINAAIPFYVKSMSTLSVLPVVRTMALEETALSTLSIPSAKPRRVERKLINQCAFRPVLQ
ncbi:hypothetical protein KCP77_22890 [Salmonella enterica subsp. enterica]|nr:hypothetical protein KCP77_22890 [Salmonella enterica subsp. enterica]